MKISRLSGSLAVACLFVSATFSTASAQGARDAYGNPKAAPSPRPMGSTSTRRAAGPARPQPTYSPANSSSSVGTGGVRFGFRAGLNVADLQGDAVQSFTSLAGYAPDGAVSKQVRPGFYAGVFATLPLGPGFALEPGITYAEKGAVLKGTLPFPALDLLNASVTGTARLAYIDVPVLAKVYLTPGLYLYAGPQASFLVSGKARVDASVLGFSAYKEDFDVASQLRKVDFAAVGGLGYQFDNGLGLSAGYDYGFTSLDAGNRFQAYNRVAKVGLSYAF